MEDKNEAWITGIGLLTFAGICLFASWLGEKMHRPENYYGGNRSYLQESCDGCNQP